ncbi:hypothetical protein [Streptomyces griseus]|uniref:hypothetical protein n=1 Tax=Streptomyces griseus TaxID=1911 RepID=UPI0033C1965F
MNDKIDVRPFQAADGSLALPLPQVTSLLRQLADNVERWEREGRSVNPPAELRHLADAIDDASRD